MSKYHHGKYINCINSKFQLIEICFRNSLSYSIWYFDKWIKTYKSFKNTNNLICEHDFGHNFCNTTDK